MQLILLLLSDVEHVVLRQLIASQNKRQTLPDIVEIALVHLQPAIFERGLRREHNVLDVLPFVVEEDVEHLLVLTLDGVAIEHLHLYVLPEGVLVARLFEFFFFGGETLNDFLRTWSPWAQTYRVRLLGQGTGSRDQGDQQKAKQKHPAQCGVVVSSHPV